MTPYIKPDRPGADGMAYDTITAVIDRLSDCGCQGVMNHIGWGLSPVVNLLVRSLFHLPRKRQDVLFNIFTAQARRLFATAGLYFR